MILVMIEARTVHHGISVHGLPLMFLKKPLVLFFEFLYLFELLIVNIEHGVVFLEPSHAILHALILNTHSFLKHCVFSHKIEN